MRFQLEMWRSQFHKPPPRSYQKISGLETLRRFTAVGLPHTPGSTRSLGMFSENRRLVTSPCCFHRCGLTPQNWPYGSIPWFWWECKWLPYLNYYLVDIGWLPYRINVIVLYLPCFWWWKILKPPCFTSESSTSNVHQYSPVSAMWLATCGSFVDFGDQERIKSVFLTGHQSVRHLVMLHAILINFDHEHENWCFL